MLYSAVMVPWSISFAMHDSCTEPGAATEGCMPSALHSMDIGVDVVFWLDLALGFRTGFLDEHGDAVLRPGRVAWEYARSHFLVDLVSVFPFEPLAKAVLAGSARSNTLVLRLLKLPRLLRISRLLKKMDTLAAADGFRIAKLALAFLILGHWVGCLWYFLGHWQMEHRGYRNALTGDQTWIEGFPAAAAGNASLAYVASDLRTKYTAALYWTMTTMATVGYGDIVPLTNAERAFACVVELLGAVCTALVFGNVALLVQGLDGAGARLRDRLDTLAEFASRHELPPALAGRLRGALAHAAAAHGGLDPAACLAELPAGLRGEVLDHLQAGALPLCRLFTASPRPALQALALRLRPLLLLPADAAFRAGDLGRSLYLLSRGRLQLTLIAPGDELVDGASDDVPAQPAPLALLGRGDCFGEQEALFPWPFAGGVPGLPPRRACAAVAVTHVEAHALETGALGEVLSDYPELAGALRGAALDLATALALQLRAAGAHAAAAAVEANAGLGAAQPAASALAPASAAEAEAGLAALLTWQAGADAALHRQLAALEAANAVVRAKLALLSERQAAQGCRPTPLPSQRLLALVAARVARARGAYGLAEGGRVSSGV